MTPPPGDREGLHRLLPLLAEHPGLDELLGRRTASLAVPEAARAPALAGLGAASGRRPLLVAVPTRAAAESLAVDLAAFLGADEVEELPAWETLPFERVSPSILTMGRALPGPAPDDGPRPERPRWSWPRRGRWPSSCRHSRPPRPSV